MALPLNTAVSNLRARLFELTAGHWTDAELSTWLNEAAAEFSSRTECLQDTEDCAVTANVRTVTPAADTMRVYHAEFFRTSGDSNIYPLQFVDYQSMQNVWGNRQNQEFDYPEYFTLWGTPPSLSVIMFPTPPWAGTLRLFYYRSAAVVTGSTALDMPAGWERYAYDYAEYRAFLRSGDDRWQQALARHEQNIGQVYEMTRRFSDQSGQIIAAGDRYEPWFNKFGGW